MPSFQIHCSDNVLVIVEKEIALRSELIRNLAEDMGEGEATNQPIPLPMVSSTVLAKVYAWCSHHRSPGDLPDANDRPQWTEVGPWDREFFMQVDQQMLFDIIMAANYLDISDLLDMACQVVADSMKGLTPEELRQKFNLEDDLTREEKEQIRGENEWVEDR